MVQEAETRPNDQNGSSYNPAQMGQVPHVGRQLQGNGGKSTVTKSSRNVIFRVLKWQIYMLVAPLLDKVKHLDTGYN